MVRSPSGPSALVALNLLGDATLLPVPTESEAYICPVAEIEREATLVIDLIEEWGVPKTVIQKLFKLHVEPLKKQVETKPQDAQAALRSLFQEKDSWAEYAEDYEDQMKLYTRWLFPFAIIRSSRSSPSTTLSVSHPCLFWDYCLR